MMDSNNSTLPDLPMKWHKLLAYFGLWMGALSNFGTAGMLISGMYYGTESDRELVYQFYKGLKAVDVICALGFVLVAIFSIYTAIQLIKLKVKAPKKLMILYVITLAMQIIYLIMASLCTRISITELIDSSTFSSVIGCVIGLVICKTYYGKRMHMFVY